MVRGLRRFAEPLVLRLGWSSCASSLPLGDPLLDLCHLPSLDDKGARHPDEFDFAYKMVLLVIWVKH